MVPFSKSNVFSKSKRYVPFFIYNRIQIYNRKVAKVPRLHFRYVNHDFSVDMKIFVAKILKFDQIPFFLFGLIHNNLLYLRGMSNKVIPRERVENLET